MRTAFLTEDLVRGLVPEATGIVERVIGSGLTEGRKGLAVIIGDTNGRIRMDDDNIVRGDGVLAGFFVGESDRRDFFHEVASSKFAISHETGLSTSQVPLHRRRFGDTRYYGSVVLENVIVAGSGFQAYYDEMVSYTIAARILAAQKAAIAAFEADKDNLWLP
jgi:fructose-1,6-bisphosphatase/inositol monophosphatase family enzyme